MSSPEHEDPYERRHELLWSALKVGAVVIAANVGFRALTALGHTYIHFKT